VANGNRQTFKVAKALCFVIGAPHSIQRPPSQRLTVFFESGQNGSKIWLKPVRPELLPSRFPARQLRHAQRPGTLSSGATASEI
jgi:hypothetical protein